MISFLLIVFLIPYTDFTLAIPLITVVSCRRKCTEYSNDNRIIQEQNTGCNCVGNNRTPLIIEVSHKFLKNHNFQADIEKKGVSEIVLQKINMDG